ncbi:aldo/keto reductase [Synechococcus sp. PCC 7336]|uniref:aldo/keto reductase n=1 Tax=Synechococcus sp. PCC 7336 TaxID=195250 RepID=UPI0003493588|nr:aldo/keto reductase [Synechococcus sp. PCC 7336]
MISATLPLPFASRVQFTDDMTICRLLNGMWQVSGAHGTIDPQAALAAMFRYVDAGYTTWDLADHYGPAEDFIGAFRRELASQRGQTALKSMQAFTKWVPRPGRMTRQVVERNLNLARRRMGVETLDLLQFHWWDYSDPRYLDALQHMVDLQGEGAIRHLGVTNFDTEHLGKIADSEVELVSNQVQFSLVDRRPLQFMVPFCLERGIKLLAYGTLCGGLLSQVYLDAPEPQLDRLATVSLRKYKQMVDVWGGWELFQDLLHVLDRIARKHQVSLANVAVRYVLDQPAVAGAIVGARLGIAEHIEDNARVFGFQLDPADLEAIAQVSSRSRDLIEAIGDCGDEYRRR